MTRNIENHYAVCHIVIVMVNVFVQSVVYHLYGSSTTFRNAK